MPLSTPLKAGLNGVLFCGIAAQKRGDRDVFDKCLKNSLFQENVELFKLLDFPNTIQLLDLLHPPFYGKVYIQEVVQPFL